MSAPSHVPPTFIFIGSSGVGKTSVLEGLLQDSELRAVRCIATTSRAPRPGERDGEDYHFVSPGTFQELLAHDAFLEHVEIYGHYYGIQRADLDKLRAGTRPILIVMEPTGARAIKALDPEHVTVVLLEASPESLLRRLHERHLTPEDVEARTRRFEDERQTYPAFADLRLQNNDGAFGDTIHILKARIQAAALA